MGGQPPRIVTFCNYCNKVSLLGSSGPPVMCLAARVVRNRQDCPSRTSTPSPALQTPAGSGG
jgi:hypothetical protein